MWIQGLKGLTSIQSFTLFNSRKKKKTANIWRVESEAISAIQFEAAQLHFLSDVFVAVAVVVA